MPRTNPVDGRTARAERTRAAVVDALLDLIESGELRPSAQTVAERAGVSLRIVFHHFDDLTALFAAAAARHSERLMADLKPLSGKGTLIARLEAFVRQRVVLYERIYNVRRAARLHEHDVAPIGRTLQLVRALKREEAERIFAVELERVPLALRPDRAAALGAVTSFNTWESLRGHQQLSVEDARRVWRSLIAAVVILAKEDPCVA